MLDIQVFRRMKFVEQIELLTSIGQESDMVSLPHLWELYTDPLGDKPVDAMIEHILCDLLYINEKEVLNQLTSKKPKIRKLCIQVVGRKNFQSAASILVELAKKEKDRAIFQELFITMSRLKTPDLLPIFQTHIMSPDQVVASISIRMLGEYKDISILNKLFKIIEDAETLENYELCSPVTAQTIETLAELKSPEAIEFLVSKIHHKNPTARRIISEELVKLGTQILPFIEKIFDQNNIDDKILAANTLAILGDKKSGEILISALDNGKADDPNVRFAIYEAFGNIKFMKGLICLLDALADPDPLILVGVVHALDKQINKTVIEKIKEAINRDGDISRHLLKAIITAEAVEIFAALYEYPNIADRLVKIISLSNDEQIISTFLKKLAELSGPNKKEHLKTLENLSKREIIHTILAVDDSRSMLSFYRATLAEAGYKVFTALNGQEALDLLDSEGMVDMVISDMNMPVMDGITFTRKMKENPFYADIPVIMSTTESDSSQQQLACSVGVKGFLMKPMRSEQLIECIKRYIGSEL